MLSADESSRLQLWFDASIRVNVAELCHRVNSKANGAALGADLLEAFVR
ncbi:hypothetical protein ABZ897_60570 [Nonomuraea sp. NPDC046802]